MRLIFGMIFGAALTVGGAYVVRHRDQVGPDARPMVNWDVVGQERRYARDHDQAGLGQADRLDAHDLVRKPVPAFGIMR